MTKVPASVKQDASIIGVILITSVTACSPSSSQDQPETSRDFERPSDTAGRGPCPPCDVRLSFEVRLGDVDGPGQVSEQASLVRGPDHRFYLVSNFEPGVIKVFRPDGSFLTALGGQGNGPGEFQNPWVVIPEEDVITVFDPFAGRVTRLSIDFEHLETRNLPARPVTAVRVATDVYALSVSPGRNYEAEPVQVYHWKADHLTPVDSIEQVFEQAGRPSSYPRIAAGSDETLWIAMPDRYRIHRRSLRNGALVRQIDHSAEWFTAGQRREPGLARLVPPRPTLARMVENDQRQVWVLAHDASSEWRALDPMRTRGGETYTSDSQLDLLHESVVDVFDADSGVHLGSGRFTGRVLGFADADRVYRYAEDATGNPYYEVYVVSLVPSQVRSGFE